jgi:hypothetical protein
VFNGKEIVLIDETSNVYATAPQPGGLADTIFHFVRDLGMRLPLALLLVSQLPAELKDRVPVGRLYGEDEHPWSHLSPSPISCICPTRHGTCSGAPCSSNPCLK